MKTILVFIRRIKYCEYIYAMRVCVDVQARQECLSCFPWYGYTDVVFVVVAADITTKWAKREDNSNNKLLLWLSYICIVVCLAIYHYHIFMLHYTNPRYFSSLLSSIFYQHAYCLFPFLSCTTPNNWNWKCTTTSTLRMRDKSRWWECKKTKETNSKKTSSNQNENKNLSR